MIDVLAVGNGARRAFSNTPETGCPHPHPFDEASCNLHSVSSPERAVRLAARALAAPLSLIASCHNSEGRVECAYVDPSLQLSSPEAPALPCPRCTLLEAGTPVLAEDGRSILIESPGLADLGIVSALAVPIPADDGCPSGCLFVLDTRPRQWTQADIDTAADIAALLSQEDSATREAMATALRERTKEAMETALRERTEALEALRLNEERFRALIENSSDIITILDESGVVTYDGPSVHRVLGYGNGERVGQFALSLVYPDDVPVAVAALQAAKDQPGAIITTEVRLMHKDGSWRTVEITGSNQLDNPAIRGITIHGRDITERREAQETTRESEQRFRLVWETSADGMRLTDANGTIVMVNPAFCRIVGMSERQLVGQPYTCVYADPEKRVFPGDMSALMREHHVPAHIQNEVQLHDGRIVCLEASNSLLEREGQPPLLLSSFRDTTERKRSEEALQHYRLLSEHVNDMMLFLRKDGTILQANDAAVRVYGYSREELLAMDARHLAAPGPSRELADLFEKAQKEPVVFSSRHRRKDGSIFPVEVSLQGAVIRNEPVILSTIRDTTERTAFEEQLAHQAFHDPLTQLPNRALFLNRLDHALSAARVNGALVGVLFLDLDRFKVVNDSLGHQCGDQLLVAIAGRLRSCIRSSDTAARFGGDEFTILLEGIPNEGEATRTAERIIRRLQAPFEIQGQEVFVTVSIGIAISGNGNETPDDLLRDADMAMYQAKSTGKARHVIFRNEMGGDVRERLQLETDLRRAIERAEFEVHYQPIVLMESRRTIGVEALVRWRHPRFGLMPPDDFVPLQEQIGLIGPFTVWVLREAQTQCLEWQQQGLHLGVSVNLSVHNLHESGFANTVGRLLKETGLTPSALKLEITESAVMMNPTRALEILTLLNGMGVRLSIDDFGTGYSSLSYLKQLPVHEIKIDKSFVLGMDTKDDDDAAIVRATIELAHNLRKKVVAEGVESEAVWDLLNLLGCDAAQGFYMGKAMPPKELAEWLRTSPFGVGAHW